MQTNNSAKNELSLSLIAVFLGVLAFFGVNILPVGAANAVPSHLPDPTEKPGDTDKPVQVYILAGQSNMVGTGLSSHLPMAAAEGGDAGKDFKRLLDSNGKVIERKDVWIYYQGRKGNLTAEYGGRGNQIGPEFGFGWEMGERLSNQVLLIKTAWGGHSLKETFLPPSAGGPGPSYTELVKTVHDVLGNLKTHFPQYDGKGYQIVGLVWHQAWNDMIDRGQRGESPPYKNYTERQAMLLRDLRKEFKAPGMLMTIGECGVGGVDGGQKSFRQAQEATALMPELKKTVRFVKTAQFWDTDKKYSSNGGYHYNGSGRTYYRKGVAFALAMYDLMPKITLKDLSKYVDEFSKPAYAALKRKQYPKAYQELRKFEAVFEANRKSGKLDEKALDMQETVLDILKREIDGPIDMATAEIAELKARGDLYPLSLVYPKYNKLFKGIAKFDEAAESLGKQLTSAPGRKAVSSGRLFYRYIDKIRLVEARLKGPRTAAHIREISAYLNRFAKLEKGSIYGKAALIAVEQIADPEHTVSSAAAYIQAVK